MLHSSLVVAARVSVRRCLVGNDLFCDNEFFSGVEGCCPIVYFGDDCHCPVDEFDVGFVVAKSLLQSVGSSFIIVVLVHNCKWSWFPCLHAIVQDFSS